MRSTGAAIWFTIVALAIQGKDQLTATIRRRVSGEVELDTGLRGSGSKDVTIRINEEYLTVIDTYYRMGYYGTKS